MTNLPSLYGLTKEISELLEADDDVTEDRRQPQRAADRDDDHRRREQKQHEQQGLGHRRTLARRTRPSDNGPGAQRRVYSAR